MGGSLRHDDGRAADDRSNKVYAAMGYGGNGITFSQIAAEILDHRDPDGELFAFR